MPFTIETAIAKIRVDAQGHGVRLRVGDEDFEF